MIYLQKSVAPGGSVFSIHSPWLKRLAFIGVLCISALALSSFQAYGNITLSNNPVDPSGQDYNLLIGELRLNLGAGTTLRWDSNFNRSSSNPESTLSIIPSIFIDAYWPISPYLQFSTGTSIGYEIFLEGEGNAEDGLVIGGLDESATTRLDFDIMLSNDAIITASNSFSANIASASSQNDAGQRQDQPFRRFSSTTSLRYAQRVTPKTRTSFGYSFTDVFTKNVTNDNLINNSLDSQTHTAFGEVGTQLNNFLILSLQGNAADTQYSEALRNDYKQYQIGPRITYISDSGLTSSVYVAFNQLDFDTTNNPAANDNQSSSIIFQSSLNFMQRNRLSHFLGLNYLQEPSNATTANPGSTGDTIPSNFQDRTEFSYGLGYPLTERLNIRLSYGLGQIKESDGGNEYYRETVSAGFPLQLNARTSISTSYTYFNVFGSEFDEFNHDQHLVEMTFRLNF